MKESLDKMEKAIEHLKYRGHLSWCDDWPSGNPDDDENCECGYIDALQGLYDVLADLHSKEYGSP